MAKLSDHQQRFDAGVNRLKALYRLCRMRHQRYYAEFRNMPNDRAVAAA
jgi:hypothetical protein